MESARIKIQIAFLILSFILSILGMSVIKFSKSPAIASNHKPMTDAQKLTALEQSAPKSPEMERFLKHEKASVQADQEAADMLPH